MSSRRKRSPEEQARRDKIRELLHSSGVSSMEDIRNLFKDIVRNSAISFFIVRPDSRQS